MSTVKEAEKSRIRPLPITAFTPRLTSIMVLLFAMALILVSLAPTFLLLLVAILFLHLTYKKYSTV
ncbi:hypothetical protein [Yersinia rochesterensis]|uniref:Uncharacterized protein n=1 Tax=Yersinia rochesterensis TaxID=1604335 RepID=A0A8D4N6W2_9GAMM|nr:hypothetical protein [Yersinia rochesterensis]AYD45340.1 hypothetical protein DXZ79_17560 [Yersinia rochesterensis]MDN0108400.1 hypothetical protein [Yersinia rochesterensis]